MDTIELIRATIGFVAGKRGCAFRGVHQQVKVAFVVVLAREHRTVDARVCDAVAADKLPQFIAVRGKGFGWFHNGEHYRKSAARRNPFNGAKVQTKAFV
jgi:hypothetical protein